MLKMNKESKNEEISPVVSNNTPPASDPTPQANSVSPEPKSKFSDFPGIFVMIGYFFYYLIALLLSFFVAVFLMGNGGSDTIGYLGAIFAYLLSIFFLIIAAPNPQNKRVGIKVVFAIGVVMLLNQICGPLY